MIKFIKKFSIFKAMNRNAQSLPINVMVLMIIAVIVLVTILVIFNKQIFKSEQKLEGVSSPLEAKSKCLSTWEESGFASYNDCVDYCTSKESKDDERCSYG